VIRLHAGPATADSVKLRIALAETGRPYERVPVDTAALANWRAPHRAIAPQGQVPVLEDQGLAMTDSGFALQYLAEAYAPNLRPADPWHWYETQALLQRIEMAIGPAVNLIGWRETEDADTRAAFRAALAEVPGREKPAGWFAVWADAEASEDAVANAVEKIEGALDELEERLVSGDWLVGDAFSLADIGAFALVRAVRAVRPGLVAARPRLGAWLARVAARPAAAALESEQVEFSPPG